MLSTWAICSTSAVPLATPRLIVSPVALPSRSRNGWATRDQPGLGAAAPGEADEHLAGQEPAVVVAPDQPVALERQQQPGGGRLASPVAALSSVNVTGSGECTTSASSRAARSTAWVPLGWSLHRACVPAHFGRAASVLAPMVPLYGT